MKRMFTVERKRILVAEESRISRLRTLLIDRYQFENILGSGGAGSVFLVMNLRLNRIEALKVLAKPLEEDPQYHVRFTHEAKVSASLNHPNIITIYDFGEIEGIYWYTMEYIDGLTLSQMLAFHGPINEPTMAEIAIPILEALAYTHKRHIIHRDIKPSNIMLDSLGHPRLMDFGIAKTSENLMKTQTGFILGTPAYIAPEQASGKILDGRTDIYSLGITLYETLAGVIPFSADSILQMVVKRITESPVPLTDKCPGIHPHIEQIIMRSLACDPELRFASATEMQQELVRFQNNIAPKPDLAELVHSSSQEHLLLPATQMDMMTVKLDRSTRRPRVLAIALAIFLVLSLAVVLKTWVFTTQPDSPTHSMQPPNPTSTKEPYTIPQSNPERLNRATIPQNQPSAKTPSSVSSGPNHSPKKSTMSLPPAQTEIRRPVQMPRQMEVGTQEFPAETMAICAGKIVNLSLVIGTDGHVKQVKVLFSPAPECAKAATWVAEKYQYFPALDALGQPIEATIAVAIEFPANTNPE